MDKSTDEEILRLSYKNPARFSELFDRHYKRFLKIARKTLRATEDAEDTVQETFVKIYKYGKKFSASPGGKFTQWSNAILNNCIADKINSYKNTDVSLTEEMESVIPDPNFSEDFGDKNYVNFIFKKIDRAAAESLKLRFIFGKSFKQIAKILGIRSGAARVRVHRAKKMFEEAYNQFNIYGE